MLKLILGVLAGFATMGVLAVGTDIILSQTFPTQFQLGDASRESGVLVVTLTYTLLFCAAGGYVAALIAGENALKAAIVLGALIALATIVNLVRAPATLPLWWKFAGGGLCGPFTILGGWLRAKQKAG